MTLAAGQTISVKVKVVPEKGNSSTGFGFRVNDVYKAGGTINGWTTLSWTADVDTVIDYIQIRPYDAANYTYTISIASIIIS